MIKIIIAEDESLELEYLTFIINKNESMKVIGQANNGWDAVRITKQLEPDLAILDISMPLKNGIDAGIEIKKFNPGIKIILNSAYSEFQYAKQAIKYGFNDYLLKPTEESKIISTIKNLFYNKSVVSSELLNTTEDRFKFIELLNQFNSCLTNYNRRDCNIAAKKLASLIGKQLNLELKMTYINHVLLSIENNLLSLNKNINDQKNIFGYLSSLIPQELTYDNLEKYFQILSEESLNLRHEDTLTITIIKKYINNNFISPNLSLSELSQVFYINKSYLSRIFKETENITISNYIENLRLERSLELIDSTDLKISEVWKISGFKNKQQFYRAFNSKYKITPIERREKNAKYNK